MNVRRQILALPVVTGIILVSFSNIAIALPCTCAASACITSAGVYQPPGSKTPNIQCSGNGSSICETMADFVKNGNTCPSSPPPPPSASMDSLSLSMTSPTSALQQLTKTNAGQVSPPLTISPPPHSPQPPKSPVSPPPPSCGPNQTLSGGGYCQCNAGYAMGNGGAGIGQTCIACPAGSSSAQGDKCRCPDGNAVPSTGICPSPPPPPACGPNETFYGGACHCNANYTAVSGPQGANCFACPTGATANNGSECRCPNGSYVAPTGTCSKSPPASHI